jgi:DNA-binding XRE family transcriptional regulator
MKLLGICQNCAIAEMVTKYTYVGRKTVDMALTYLLALYKIQRTLIHALPSVRFARTFPRPEPLKYPKNLKTIGDHIRKRRMDKGLSQSKRGQIFTVSKDCVTN